MYLCYLYVYSVVNCSTTSFLAWANWDLVERDMLIFGLFTLLESGQKKNYFDKKTLDIIKCVYVLNIHNYQLTLLFLVYFFSTQTLKVCGGYLFNGFERWCSILFCMTCRHICTTRFRLYLHTTTYY